MAVVTLDLDLAPRQAEARAAALASPRRRAMLAAYARHARAEVAGDLEAVMATMVAEPVFHIWHGGQEIGPKGRAAVEAMYRQMFESGGNHFEMDIRRLVVDDGAIVKEFVQRKILSGRAIAAGPSAETLRAAGEAPDPAGHYLTEGRVLVILPFDERGLMLGEDAYSAGGTRIRRLAPDELPERFLARS